MSRDYKNTVFLPQTAFAMKANLAQRENDFLEFWNRIEIFTKLRAQSANKKKFVLHFGPPYANGHLHIGHALSYILKDVLNKTYQMSGYDAPLVPGWDCHGLPTELKVEENYRSHGLKKEEVPVLEYIQACRDFAQKWIDVQASELARFGLIADLKNHYKTMNFTSESKIVSELYKFLMNGGLYRGLKPVLWSVVEKTALAEAEVEYKDHTSDTVFVGFKIAKTDIEILKNSYAVIWTTTPWTLPGNRAIAYGNDHTYAVIEVIKGTDLIPNGHKLLIAKDLVTEVVNNLGIEDYALNGEVKGNALKGAICNHPWHGKGYDFEVPLLPGEHVTTDAGTGLVHTAPAHGMEDFIVAQEFNISIPETVQNDGTYASDVPLFAGQHIFKIAPFVIEELRKSGALLKNDKLLHSYPHSWRSKAPLIYRATSQWFISMDKNDLKKKAIDAIETVEWYPSMGQNRISAMIQNRPDWCLSRQRTWGVPIAIFVDKQTKEPLKDLDVCNRIITQIEKEGISAWHAYDSSFFLGSKYNPENYEKITDILDVWFESACTNAFVLEARPDLKWPADIYFEGSDQHRGWFHTSLLHSCGTRGKPPYNKVITHGFVLDEKGHKMSKSVGNTVSPNDVINTMGADMLRLWVACSDYTDDVRIGKEILKHIEDIYRRLRNTLRYLLGALNDFDVNASVAYEDMPDLEKWVLHRLKELDSEHSKVFKTYDFAAFYNEIHSFCTSDLSAFYFDIRKDCLYCDAENSNNRLSALTVMHQVFEKLVKWLAPVLSFTAEEAWHTFKKVDTKTTNKPISIHLETYSEIPRQWENPSLASRFEELRQIRRLLTGALELERASKTIGSSLQAKVIIYINSEWGNRLDNVDWAEFAIASQTVIAHAQVPTNAFTLDDVKGVGAVVELAEGNKCSRCWKILPEVGQQTHEDLCKRCDTVINECESSRA